MSAVLNNLEVIVLESEDSCMIVIKNHDGGGVWHLKLSNWKSSNSCWIDDDSVLGADTKVGKAEIEVLVLLKDIIVDNINGDFLMFVFWVESQSSLDWNIITSSVGSSVFSKVIDHDSETFWSSISEKTQQSYRSENRKKNKPSDNNIERSNTFKNSVVSWIQEDLASVVTQLLLLCLYQLKLAEVFRELGLVLAMHHTIMI